MTSGGPRYATAAAFVRALNQQLRAAAHATGRPVEELRRQFLTHRLLARVFLRPDSGWVLLGGVGLLVRVPGARATQDVDLLHTVSSVEEALLELVELLATPHLDPFTFQLGTAQRLTGRTPGAQVSVAVLAGATRVGTFPIDLVVGRTMTARTQLLRPQPVIEIDDVGQLPQFVVYPVEDQVADKLCAMYARYGRNSSPSTRYHDLVDLVVIARELPVDATLARAAIDGEQQRRRLTVPIGVPSPAAGWGGGYKTAAARSNLPAELHDLETALTVVRQFVHPLLDGRVQVGRWDPGGQAWI